MLSASNKQSKTNDAFSPEDGKIIREFVQGNGYKRIPELAAQLLNRIVGQILDYYCLYLDQNVNHDESAIEENSKVIQCVNKFGKK
jgi:hypothetical protein